MGTVEGIEETVASMLSDGREVPTERQVRALSYKTAVEWLNNVRRELVAWREGCLTRQRKKGGGGGSERDM